jgi:FMN-dependent oxidoreductase (nitrilotriacetate monooxygenase family)
MTDTTRQLHLSVNVHGVGISPMAWQFTSGGPLGALDGDHFARVAQIAERGHLDGFFLADSLAPPFPPEYGIVWGLDPLLILSSVAAATERIGLIASVSTTFNEPYNVARSVASLDYLSRGRASWNVVTSYDQMSARKYGLERLPERSERYRRAAEFVEVVRALWDSWDDEAIVLDRERNVFAESPLVRAVEHHGEFFEVSGALQLPRPPQGHPVLFQAGASEAGLDLAARYADGVFSAQHTVRGAVRSYDDLKRRVAAVGRRAAVTREARDHRRGRRGRGAARDVGAGPAKGRVRPAGAGGDPCRVRARLPQPGVRQSHFGPVGRAAADYAA